MLTGSFTGTGIGAPAWGLVYDLTGDFTLAMYMGGACGLIGLLLVFIAMRRGLRTRAALNETSTTGIFLPDNAEEASEELVAEAVVADAGSADEVAAAK